MTQIRCNNCGTDVPSHYQQCPRCGAHLMAPQSEDTQLMPLAQPQYSAPAPYGPPQPGKSTGIGLKVAVIVLATLAFSLVIGVGWYLYDKKQKAEQAALEQAELERARQDSIAAVEQARLEAERAEVARQDSIIASHEAIKEAYLSQLRKYRVQDEAEGGYYFLYDITGDGVPEIWMCGGFGYSGMYAYTYTDGRLEEFHTGNGGHASYHRGNGYVIENMAHMGYQSVVKISYSNGQFVETLLSEVKPDYDSEEYPDYVDIKEPGFQEIPLTNEAPIRAMFPQ